MQNRSYNSSVRLKTEKALEAINQIGGIQDELNNKLQRFKENMFPKVYPKMINEGTWIRVQLMSSVSQLYELMPSKIKESERDGCVLKIVIKNFTGTAVFLSLSSRPQLIKPQQCEHKITGQKLFKYRHPPLINNKIYLTLHAPIDLNLFRLKYQFVPQREEFSRSKSSSLKLLNLPQFKDLQISQTIITREESIINLKKGFSPKNLIIDRSRLESGRVESIEKEKVKLQNVKEKRYHLEVYREKSKSLKSLSKDCTNILKEYKEHMGIQGAKRKEMLKALTLSILMINFVGKTNQSSYDRQRGIKRAVKMKVTMKHCAHKMMQMVKQLKSIEPQWKDRQLLTVYHSTSALSRLISNKAMKSAREMVASCFQETLIANSLNNLLNYAAVYRKKMRTIQRYWKTRNKAQMSIFKHYIQVQNQKFLTKHLYFCLVKQQFLNRNMPFNLSWQYLKQSSLKVNKVMGAYISQLQQIQELKRMNIQIKQFNSKALKKHIKPYFDIPRKPSRPLPRYFRDIAILKSMLRSWFEIQYRRYVRKLKKQGKQINVPII